MVEQLLLLLTCIEGCDLRNNKFKVCAAACVLYINIILLNKLEVDDTVRIFSEYVTLL